MKLKVLSAPKWCTKADKAYNFLEGNNFHLYFEDSEPKLAVTIKDNIINCIYNRQNHTELFPEYYDLFIDHASGYKISDLVKRIIDESKKPECDSCD